jgi:hypothetical protein
VSLAITPTQELAEPLELKGKSQKARAFIPTGIKSSGGAKKVKIAMQTREEVLHC